MAPSRPGTGPHDARPALARALRRARLSLAWETAWPRLALSLCLMATGSAAAWLGLLDRLPGLLRLAVAGAVVLAAAAAALAAALALVRLPERAAARRRVERDNALADRPIAVLDDRPATGAGDPAAAALWNAHLRQMSARLVGLRVAPPAPRLDRRDPYALRAVAMLLLVIGYVAAAPDHLGPIARAFRLPAAAVVASRVDVWVTPPLYTGEPPRYLAAGAEVAPVRMPEGSIVTLRVAGAGEAAAAVVRGDGRTDLAGSDSGGAHAFSWTADRPADLVLSADGREIRRYAVEVTPDRPPAVALTEAPSANPRGALHLAYRLSDDYRVAEAHARLTLPEVAGARPLASLPDVALVPPKPGSETAVTERDLSSHPLAGSDVELRLSARDDRGQSADSAPVTIRLPTRNFRNPLARMLVEERGRLARDANAAGDVARTLDTIGALAGPMIAAARIAPGFGVIETMLRTARDDGDLVSAMDFMWTMALGLESGDRSAAEERLRQVREALRDALARDAGKDEIARLTDELKAALDDFLKELAQSATGAPPDALSDLDRSGAMKQVTPDQLRDLIDRMGRLGSLGDQAGAEQLLSQLDDILDNLGPNGRGGGSAGKGGDPALDRLADIIRRQQELMNDTHRLTPDGGDPGDGGDDRLAELGRRQDGLRQELQRLIDGLPGADENGGDTGAGRLGDAGKAMRGAGDRLGDKDAEAALGEQGEALEAMRDGARAMGRAAGRQQGAGGEAGSDPLGRPNGRTGADFGDSTRVPGEIDVQRVRRLIEELRRRYSDPGRPSIELDYLRRLLAPY